MNHRCRYLLPSLCLHAAVLSLSLSLSLAGPRPLAADEVLIRAAGEGERLQRRQGEVLEYTGRELTLRLADGRQERHPADRVVEVRPDKSPQHAAADRLRGEGRFADALAAYRQARSEARYNWLRRLLLAREAMCYAAEGQVRYAGEAFLSVVRSDPTTPYFAAIPLPWARSRGGPDVEQAAAEWLNQRDLPAARLMGAAWLLGSSQRAVALETLRQLAGDTDPRVARLAEAQLWRAEYVTSSPDEVTRWWDRVAAMPAELRYGPYYVLGLAFEQHGRHEEAALAWMRVPILHSDQYPLAAASLWQAAGALEQAGQAKEAGGLLREIVDRYAASEYVGRARQRIEERERQALSKQ